jgi:segregation and condensation protein B
MELSEIIPHIEALIFASEKPLAPLEIVDLVNNAFGFMEERISLDQVESALQGIHEKYNSEFYPFEVRESGGGWQFLTKKDFHKTIALLNGERYLKRLSSAALETLAIIAYKQPITKGEIEAIRGVNSDYSIQKLLEKELIVITGRNEKLPGHPLVYSTSKTFMDYFGINSVDDLPKIKEVLGDQLVEPTMIRHSEEEILPEERTGDEVNNDEQTEASQILINEEGQLIEGNTDENDLNEEGSPSINDATSSPEVEGNSANESEEQNDEEGEKKAE